jgi:hypothetical protein
MVCQAPRHCRDDLLERSYLAGTVWPLVIQPLVQWVGWRHTYVGIAVFCLWEIVQHFLAQQSK